MNSSLSDLNFRVLIRVKNLSLYLFPTGNGGVEKYKFDRSRRHAEYRLDIDFPVLIDKLPEKPAQISFCSFNF